MKKVEYIEPSEDDQIEYLAEILFESFLDMKARTDPKFRDPRIGRDIRNLVQASKEREKMERKRYE